MPSRRIEQAYEFLQLDRIALVGLSREPRSLSRLVLRELLQRGHDVVPVNPALADVDGRRCFARLQDIDPPVAGALLMTPPAVAVDVVRDCLDAGVRSVWFHRGGGPGCASAAALELCRATGVDVITDLCPLMVLPGSGWLHRVHGLLRRAVSRRA